jgi:menaquinol-cytochrome c reductase iron-sulfur subunit
MPQNDEREKPATGPEELNRRDFFIKVGATSLAVAGAGSMAFALRYLSPNVLYEPSPVVSAGKPEHYPENSVTLDPRLGLFVVRSTQGFYALNAVCTHLGCLTVWKPDAGVIACPCHGSTFQRDGNVIAGPAPRPLPWLKMWMSDDGDLMVDRSAIVTPQKDYVQV